MRINKHNARMLLCLSPGKDSARRKTQTTSYRCCCWF